MKMMWPNQKSSCASEPCDGEFHFKISRINDQTELTINHPTFLNQQSLMKIIATVFTTSGDPQGSMMGTQANYPLSLN